MRAAGGSSAGEKKAARRDKVGFEMANTGIGDGS